MSEVKQEEMTQERVDEVFKEAKEQWDAMIEKSGLSEDMFISLNPGKMASTFLAGYQTAKEHVESLGLVMPVLKEGLEVTISDLTPGQQHAKKCVEIKASLTAVEYNVARLLYNGNPVSIHEDDEDLCFGAKGLTEKKLVEVMDEHWLLTDLGHEVFMS